MLGGILMAYQMTISLTDQEYAALTAEAAKKGKRPEALLHEMMIQNLKESLPIKRPLTEDEFIEKQYREGKILNIPTRRLVSPEEQAEREHLAQLFAGGKPASEMVIEDRGQY